MARPKRPVNTRELPPDMILIVTEGEKTEPLYFESFQLRTSKVVRIAGTGINTLSLIGETEVKLAEAKDWYCKEYGIKLKDKDTVVWCVFDRDSFPADHFDNAIASARAKGFHVAYSNEAFELWYLLHFSHFTSAVSRTRFQALLSDHLGKPYAKNDPCMYQILKCHQADAIRNAKALLASYDQHVPSRNNPCTTVFELVEYLNQFGRGGGVD